jgi:hypothetical protein
MQLQRAQHIWDTIRPGYGVLDWKAHVGMAQLRQHRPISELDNRMHDALGMHNNLNLIQGNPKQPPRFDHLQALVEKSRRINCDLWAHFPGRVLQRLPRRDRIQFLGRPGSKRAARSG